MKPHQGTCRRCRTPDLCTKTGISGVCIGHLVDAAIDAGNLPKRDPADTPRDARASSDYLLCAAEERTPCTLHTPPELPYPRLDADALRSASLVVAADTGHLRWIPLIIEAAGAGELEDKARKLGRKFFGRSLQAIAIDGELLAP